MIRFLSRLFACFLGPWQRADPLKGKDQDSTYITRRGLLLYTDCTSPENDNGISLFYILNPIIQKYQLENGVKR